MLGEYDAGYENYIDSLIREIEKLQDENDKLSEQVSSLVGRSFRTADKMSCIEADNAKLQDELEFANNECERAVLELLDQQGQLEAENAKLRADVDRLIQAVEDLHDVSLEDRLLQIESENDKLQNDADLLRAMLSQVQTEKRCYMAENVKLREELESVGTAAYLYGRSDLKAENAKLRELVQQMYPKAKAFLQMGVQLGCNDTLSYDWYLQLRDLGVEVDG